MYVCNCTIMQRERLANFSSIFLLTFCCCVSLRLRLVAAAFVVVVWFVFLFFVADYCCCSCTLRSSCSMAMRICMYILFKQLWTVVWSLDSLFFVEKKNKKSIAKRAEHTRIIAAHTSVKRYCGVQRLAWKWKWQWRGRGGKRNANTTHHATLSAHTHACRIQLPVSLFVWVCVCVRQCAYVCGCSCCCFSCSGALKIRSLFTCLSLRYSRLLSVWRKIDSVFRWVIWYEEIFFKHAIGL